MLGRPWQLHSPQCEEHAAKQIDKDRAVLLACPPGAFYLWFLLTGSVYSTTPVSFAHIRTSDSHVPSELRDSR